MPKKTARKKEPVRRPVIGVIGASASDEAVNDLAYKTGRVIAQRGAVLINGGGPGVMEASARGAREAGGLTVGIVPSPEKKGANTFIDLVIATGMGQARNAVIVQSADGVIAVGGSYGTLSEVAFALKDGKPIAGLSSWDRVFSEIPSFHRPEEAVDFILGKIREKI
jgi:uncharacterized protein (TIGR00725 family)